MPGSLARRVAYAATAEKMAIPETAAITSCLPLRLFTVAMAGPVSDAVSRVRRICRAETGRLAGSFSKHFVTSAAISSGQSGLAAFGDAGFSVRCAAYSCCGDLCANGAAPVNISYATQPNE